MSIGAVIGCYMLWLFVLDVLWIFDFWFLCFVIVVLSVSLVCEACLWVKIFILTSEMRILMRIVSIISVGRVCSWFLYALIVCFRCFVDF